MNPDLKFAQEVIRHDDKLIAAGLRTTHHLSKTWSRVAAKAPQAPWQVIVLVDSATSRAV